MGKVRDLANKLKQLDFEAMCVETVYEHEKEAAELNTGQLFQGERADGTMLPEYSFVSVNFYNKPQGPIRLYDTGAFYEGFKFGSASGRLEFPLYIISTDKKANELQARYGKEIFGLTQENLHGFAKVFVLPSLGKKLKSYIHV
jgi:hypothetical protein